jgi:hypothetical protein
MAMVKGPPLFCFGVYLFGDKEYYDKYPGRKDTSIFDEYASNPQTKLCGDTLFYTNKYGVRMRCPKVEWKKHKREEKEEEEEEISEYEDTFEYMDEEEEEERDEYTKEESTKVCQCVLHIEREFCIYCPMSGCTRCSWYTYLKEKDDYTHEEREYMAKWPKGV